jgi:hypothetical protein
MALTLKLSIQANAASFSLGLVNPEEPARNTDLEIIVDRCGAIV